MLLQHNFLFAALFTVLAAGAALPSIEAPVQSTGSDVQSVDFGLDFEIPADITVQLVGNTTDTEYFLLTKRTATNKHDACNCPHNCKKKLGRKCEYVFCGKKHKGRCIVPYNGGPESDLECSA